jgi:hypothetical protein
LFAGIITAFVIESRKDLKEDPQERLLKEILSALRDAPNSSPLEPFQSESSSLHMNGLWFVSLTLVLISALGGVLAKAWVAAYNPALNRARSKDACERHLRFIRSTQWKVGIVVTSIPLCIQISLLLFFAGLIIQVIPYGARISIPVITLVAITTTLYILFTILPPFFSAFPYSTPITNFFDDKSNRKYDETEKMYEEHLDNTLEEGVTREHGTNLSRLVTEGIATVWGKAKDLLEDLRHKPGLLEMQSRVLVWIIGNTTNKKAFLEATKVLGGAVLTEALRKALVENKAGDSLYQDFEGSFKSTSVVSRTVEEADRLESILFALVRIEQPLSMGERENKSGKKHPFRYLLGQGKILHRWDNFEPYLWPLTFSLRIHILISSNDDDWKDRWDQTAENLILMSGSSGKAFVRRILLSAAIQGLLVGRENIRQACAIVLSEQLKTGRYILFVPIIH